MTQKSLRLEIEGAAVFALLLALTAGCGAMGPGSVADASATEALEDGGSETGGATSDAGGASDGGTHRGGSAGSAGSAGTAGASGTSSSFKEFDIVVPGATKPVLARVATPKTPLIDVDGYPSALSLPVHYGALPVGYEGAFSDAFCADIRRVASLGSLPSLKEQVLRMVRRQGTVTARIPLSTLVGSPFSVLAVQAARTAGADAAATVSNPLSLSNAEIALELSPDAMSNLLGDTPGLLSGVSTALAQQLKIAVQTGLFTASIAAKDLWCDLAHGKATFKLKLVGTALGKPYAGVTNVSGAQPL